MNQRAKDLSERIESFRDDVIAFVQSLSDEQWSRVCASEQWPVSAAAHHIGAGHFAISDWLQMIVRGEDLPQLTMDQINAMSNKAALEHAGCSRAEAVEQLQKSGAELAAFVTGLSDDELQRKGILPAFGGEVTAEQFVDLVIFQSARQHFESMQAAAGQ